MIARRALALALPLAAAAPARAEDAVDLMLVLAVDAWGA